MIALSSLNTSISSLARSFHSACRSGAPEADHQSDEFALSSSSSASCWRDATEDDNGSVYHDVISESEVDDATTEDDRESCGGTIIASLSSRDVRRNIEDSRIEARLAEPSTLGRTYPLMLTKNTLNEVATVQSDILSFTPTMAELALSSNNPGQSTLPNRSSFVDNASTKSSPNHYTARYEGSALSALGITDVQPERVACPFCDREKDLQWRLSRERKQSQGLKHSEYRARFVLVATIVTFVVAIFSFFLGKLVSDFQSEKVISQYMAQCNEMMSQRDEEEIYWKLVTAAFSAMLNAAAGPAANFVFGGGGK